MVASYFPPIWREVELCSPDNSGQLVRNFCCWPPPQKCGTSCPIFSAAFFYKNSANLAHIFSNGPRLNVSQLGSRFTIDAGQIIRAIMARIYNFGPSWSEVPGMKNVDQLGPHFNFCPTWAEVSDAKTVTIMVQVSTSAQLGQKFPARKR